jgi:hypothetical protein
MEFVGLYAFQMVRATESTPGEEPESMFLTV